MFQVWSQSLNWRRMSFCLFRAPWSSTAPPLSLQSMLGRMQRRTMECGVIASLLWGSCAKADMGVLVRGISFVHVTHPGYS